MSLGRVDPRLVEHFSSVEPSSSERTRIHGVAASIHADASQELLKELPAVGPITYLPEIEVLLADVEVAGFNISLNTRRSMAIPFGCRIDLRCTCTSRCRPTE